MKNPVRAQERFAGVSVILPAYNAEKTIERAVDSVLDQKIHPLELILINDGSTDGTATRVKNYGKKIKVVRVKNGGVGAARNLGIRLARYPLIAFLDADDQWLPGKLRHQVEIFLERPEVALVATGVRDVDEKERFKGVRSREWSGNLWRSLVDRGDFITLSSVMLRKSALKGMKDPFTTAAWYAEDYYLWLRLAKDHDFYVSPRVLVNYTRQGLQAPLFKYSIPAIQKCFDQIAWIVGKLGDSRDVDKIYSMMRFEMAIYYARRGVLGKALVESLHAWGLSPWAGRNWERSSCAARIYLKVIGLKCLRALGLTGRGPASPVPGKE